LELPFLFDFVRISIEIEPEPVVRIVATSIFGLGPIWKVRGPTSEALEGMVTKIDSGEVFLRITSPTVKETARCQAMPCVGRCFIGCQEGFGEI